MSEPLLSIPLPYINALNLDVKVSLILSLIIISILPILLLYSAMKYGEEDAVRDAISFLKSSPTYRFDGIPDSIRVESVERLAPGRWRIILRFECRHAGYGDRSGLILLPVITPHRMEIIIERGRVVEAVVDNLWDELHQRPMGD